MFYFRKIKIEDFSISKNIIICSEATKVLGFNQALRVQVLTFFLGLSIVTKRAH